MQTDSLIHKYFYHYYYSPPGPLKSITELSDERVAQVISSTNEKTSIYHYRLTLFPDYVSHRRNIEIIMRNQLIEKGGKPERQTPFYFILGQNSDFVDKNPGCQILVVDPKKLDRDIISFTFCDSLFAYPFLPFFSENGFNLKYKRKEFHGQTYHFNELGKVLKKYGHPNHNDNHDYPFQGFIEIQLWKDIDLTEDCIICW